ncbi:MAG: flagellar basal-body rod protein FlgF [Magnetococcales bacterium]|nr:flagellar basal-body rod protein FlgF [Magnetococcales bacterium]
MDSGLYAVVNGARRAEVRLDVLSNNLANVNTNGFKEDQIVFDSYMTNPGPEQFPLPTNSFMGVRGPGDVPFPFSNPAANAYRMTYPMAVKTQPSVQQGAMRQTDNPLDVAINGRGFFAVNTPDGVRYTRDGSFQVNSLGQLVTKDGFQIASAGGAAITIDKGPVRIGQDGVVSDGNGVIGQLQLVDIPAEYLEKKGANLYAAAADRVQPLAAGQSMMQQGFVEASNSDSLRNMTRMVEAHRAFEMYTKMIQTLDNLDEQAISRVGKLE